jgi:hypothetical protein
LDDYGPIVNYFNSEPRTIQPQKRPPAVSGSSVETYKEKADIAQVAAYNAFHISDKRKLPYSSNNKEKNRIFCGGKKYKIRRLITIFIPEDFMKKLII